VVALAEDQEPSSPMVDGMSVQVRDQKLKSIRDIVLRLQGDMSTARKEKCLDDLSKLAMEFGWSRQPALWSDQWWRFEHVWFSPYASSSGMLWLNVFSYTFLLINFLWIIVNSRVVGRDFFFDLEDLARLLVEDIDAILRSPTSHQKSAILKELTDFNDNRYSLEKRIARIMLSSAHPFEDHLLTEMLQLAGWSVFVHPLTHHNTFVPPNRKQEVNAQNIRKFRASVDYFSQMQLVDFCVENRGRLSGKPSQNIVNSQESDVATEKKAVAEKTPSKRASTEPICPYSPGTVEHRAYTEACSVKPHFGTIYRLLQQLGWKTLYYAQIPIVCPHWTIEQFSDRIKSRLINSLECLVEYVDYFQEDECGKQKLFEYIRVFGFQRNVPFIEHNIDNDHEPLIKARSPRRALRHAEEPEEVMDRLAVLSPNSPAQSVCGDIHNKSVEGSDDEACLLSQQHQQQYISVDTDLLQSLQDELSHVPSFVPSEVHDLKGVDSQSNTFLQQPEENPTIPVSRFTEFIDASRNDNMCLTPLGLSSDMLFSTLFAILSRRQGWSAKSISGRKFYFKSKKDAIRCDSLEMALAEVGFTCFASSAQVMQYVALKLEHEKTTLRQCSSLEKEDEIHDAAANWVVPFSHSDRLHSENESFSDVSNKRTLEINLDMSPNTSPKQKKSRMSPLTAATSPQVDGQSIFVNKMQTMSTYIDQALKLLEPATGGDADMYPMPSREFDSSKVFGVLQDVLRKGDGAFVYIAGCPGCGKTLLMESVVRHLKNQIRTERSVNFININGPGIPDPQALVEYIAQCLQISVKDINFRFTSRGRPVSFKTTQTVSPTSILAPGQRQRSVIPTVLMINELDMMVPAAQQLIFNWSSGVDSSVVVLASGNKVNCMPNQTLHVAMEPYSESQLISILTDRAGKLFAPSAISFLAKKVGAHHKCMYLALNHFSTFLCHVFVR
jgi:hypothetical protein